MDEYSDLLKMLNQIKLNDYIQSGVSISVCTVFRITMLKKIFNYMFMYLQTLDEHICQPIEQVRFTNDPQKPWSRPDFNNVNSSNNYQRLRTNRYSDRPERPDRQYNYDNKYDNTRTSRPGLRDIV